jgi:hypothetical protein
MRRTSMVSRVIGFAAGLLAAVAVATELAKPRAERTWHGRILGVPYDFRRPTRERLVREWWRPDDPALLTPRAFGMGWGVNLARVGRDIRSLVTGRARP